MGNSKDKSGNVLSDDKEKANALYRGMFLRRLLDGPNLRMD